MSIERLAQITQDLNLKCSLDAKSDIVKIEELFIELEKKKQAFIEWLESYPLNKTCDFDTLVRADLLMEVVDKANEML